MPILVIPRCIDIKSAAPAIVQERCASTYIHIHLHFASMANMNLGFCCPRRLDAQLSGSFPFLQRGAGVLGAVLRVHEEPTSHPSVSNILLAVRRYLLDVGTVREVEVVPFARTLHTRTYVHFLFVVLCAPSSTVLRCMPREHRDKCQHSS